MVHGVRLSKGLKRSLKPRHPTLWPRRGTSVPLHKVAHARKATPTALRGRGMMRKPVTYGSERQPHKTVRAKVKQLLRKLIEPEPKYRTGKLWID